MAVDSFLLSETFVVIDAAFQASRELKRESLYQDLERNYAGFRSCELLSMHEFCEDWTSWERHPCGDEIVVLLGGEICLQLRFRDGDQWVALSRVGESVIVPKGIWHTAQVATKAKVLFFTPGEETQNQTDP